ncbi:hypothetical protein COB57_01530 [Candidatus Peregrinibacteria bacterium]|nr:MAG: hypothetical protein COB57_01530 [Candidatus Peregrinibacteria bacterium]
MSFTKKLQSLFSWTHTKSLLIEGHHLEQKNKTSHFSRLPFCSMGDIYYAKIGVNIGWEIDKTRPVIIFQGKDRFLKNSGTIFIFPITSKIKMFDYRISFDQHDIHNNEKDINIHPSQILLTQGRCISRIRLGQKIGTLSECKLREIQSQFNLFLYKNTPLHPMDKGATQTALIKKPAIT